MLSTEEELDLAAKVHYSFLPRKHSDSYVEIAVTVKPHGKIGGDYCSILPVDEKNLFACMCDAVGHGLPSALFAARINTFVLTHALKKQNPCDLTDLLNEHLCQRLPDTGMFASFSAVHFDFEAQRMELSGAAHPPAVHFKSESDKTELLSSETTLLGIDHPLPVACRSHRRKLHSGDKIILYTDGLIEARNGQGVLYGVERLQAFTAARHELQASAFNEALVNQVLDHCQGQVSDDILVMSITVK